ncbi:MAG: hypothetical protein ABIT58_09780 [Ferruginibacter sp.]
MSLTDAQIQALFLFTEKKYVRYYDLQVELVDHLATRIQEEINANQKLSFEQALEKVYADFGIFGFAKVVQEKQDQFVRMGQRLLWKEFKALFRWPQITLVALVATIAWQLTLRVSMEILFPVLFIAWIAASVLLTINIALNIKKQKKKLLSIQFSPAEVSGGLVFVESLFFSSAANHNQWLFVILVTTSFLFKLATYRVYNNLRQQAIKLYPEAFA